MSSVHLFTHDFLIAFKIGCFIYRYFGPGCVDSVV